MEAQNRKKAEILWPGRWSKTPSHITPLSYLLAPLVPLLHFCEMLGRCLNFPVEGSLIPCRLSQAPSAAWFTCSYTSAIISFTRPLVRKVSSCFMMCSGSEGCCTVTR